MLNIRKQAGLPTAGSTAQPTYDPNAVMPQAQPVYMNPDDIMSGIQQNAATIVPVSEPVGSGVGALIAPTPPAPSVFDSAPQVSVPETQAFVPQEQVAQRADQYATTAEGQFATPQAAPQLFNQDNNPSVGVAMQSLESMTQAIATSENRLGNIKWRPDDATSLLEFGRTVTDRFANPESAWAVELNSAAPLTPESAAEVTPILTVAGAKLLHNVNNRNFEKQLSRDQGLEEYDDNNLVLGVESVNKNQIADPTTEVFEAGEPILNSMVTSVTEDILKFSVPQGTKANPTQVDDARRQAVTFVKDLTDMGQIRWGRNKKGKVVPLPPVSELLNKESAKKIATLYDVYSRGSVASGLKAPTYPAMTNDMLGTAANKVFMDKKGKVKSTNAAETFMQLQGSIPLGVNPVMSEMLQQMYQTVVSGEDSIFDATLSELDAPYKEALAAKHGDQQAREILSQKFGQLEKEIGDVVYRQTKNTPHYLLSKQSPATLRYFHIANNLNIMGQKGTTRPTIRFEGTSPVKVSADSGLWSQGAPAVVSKAKQIYTGTTGKGAARGQEIQRKLYNLKTTNPSAFQALNYYYALGAQMAKHIAPDAAAQYSRDNLNNKPTSNWIPLDYIMFGTVMQGKAISMGAELVEAIRNKTLPAYAKENTWMTDKGEWQYPASVLTDAYQLSIASPNSFVRLQNMMESDARQSNAGLISIIVGDSDSASVLGLAPEMLDGNSEVAAGLREKIWDSIDTDIHSTFNGPDDGPFKTAWANLMVSLQEARGNRAAKDYGRELVVAGLYGKTPQKMYSEAQSFFTRISRIASDNVNLSKSWSDLRAAYKNDDMRMMNDLTDLYTTSMQQHMSKLNGYQNTMRSLGTAMASINAPSNITNMFGGVQELSGDNLSPVLEENIFNQAISGMQIKTNQIAGMNIPEFSVQKDYASVAEARLDGDTLVEYRFGTKQRNAWPVDVIQGGDSTIMTLAVLAMNSPEYGFKGNPVQAVAIHDALVTGPEGHLLATNAYNNIAIPTYAKDAPRLMTSVLKTYNDHLNKVKEKHKEGGANIGTMFIGAENSNKSFHGLTGFFDRLYDITYGANSQAEVDSPDLSVSNNQTSLSLEDYQLARSDAKRKSTIKGNLKNKAFLELAGKYGWIPPTVDNTEARKFNKVSGEEFIALIDLMRAHSGLMEKGEAISKDLAAALRKLPEEFRPSYNSLTRHFEKYGIKGTRETSGLLTDMSEARTSGNDVIRQLTNAYNEITHMVPA